jgi:hypothetical protein
MPLFTIIQLLSRFQAEPGTRNLTFVFGSLDRNRLWKWDG